MQKILVIVLIVIVVGYNILFTGGNTSSTEVLLDSAKVSDNMGAISQAIDNVGDGVHANMMVDVEGFKGIVEQPPSSTTEVLHDHIIKDSTNTNPVTLTYDEGEVLLTKPSGADGMWDNNLPSLSQGDASNSVPQVGLSKEDPGIKPIIKDTDNATEWIRNFIFTDQGIGIEKLNNYQSMWDSLKGDTTKQIEFLEWVFGNHTEGNAGDDQGLAWNSYRTDRIAAMRQINVDTLTGLDKNNETISQILDHNRAYIYEVFHINANNYQTISDASVLPSVVSDNTSDANEVNKFIFDLANHLNQTIGKRVLVIPNNDNSQVFDSDGNPVFVVK